MRISDWSSDVCSSDLFKTCVLECGSEGVEDVSDRTTDVAFFGQRPGIGFILEGPVSKELQLIEEAGGGGLLVQRFEIGIDAHGIGRASCRERVCQSVKLSVVAVA